VPVVLGSSHLVLRVFEDLHGDLLHVLEIAQGRDFFGREYGRNRDTRRRAILDLRVRNSERRAIAA
jgi:hypothetical protein